MRKSERGKPGLSRRAGRTLRLPSLCLSFLLLASVDFSLPRGRWTELLLLAVILAAAIAFLVSALAIISRARSTLVEVAPVRRAEKHQPLLHASGYVTPRRRATVAAKITARVKEMLVEEGMRVSEGQVLAMLDDSDARALLASASAEHDLMPNTLAELYLSLSRAKRELWRAQALPRDTAGAQEALEAAQTAVQMLQARIASAEEQMRATESHLQAARQEIENCVVRAPFSGVIISREAQAGEMVSPSSAGAFTRSGIATIVDLRSLEVEADVDEALVGRIQPGWAAVVVLNAFPEWQISARVRTIIPSADREKATVKVRVAIERIDPRILPNMAAKVSFLEGEVSEGQPHLGGMLVPKQALREENGQDVVYLFHDGKVERRAVRATVSREREAVEIIAGLAESDRVVVKGFDGLRDGKRVGVKS
jgi:RND family efflux transporter MFP subunit